MSPPLNHHPTLRHYNANSCACPSLCAPVQGYLAHKTQRPPRTLQYDYAQGHMVNRLPQRLLYRGTSPIRNSTPRNIQYDYAQGHMVAFLPQSLRLLPSHNPLSTHWKSPGYRQEKAPHPGDYHWALGIVLL